MGAEDKSMRTEEARARAKVEFLSTISHELRTPLTALRGSLGLLGRPGMDMPPEMFDQMVAVMRRGADKLERVVMSFLVVNQIEHNALSIVREDLWLEDVVKERAGVLQREHANVDLKLPETPVPVYADRERLGQALDHMLENARKFGGPEGKVTVELECDQDTAVISVTDQGPGIDPRDQGRIFDPYVRLDNQSLAEMKGAGVGLFIAKWAIEAMGGSIWVDSTPGKGSTFQA